MAGYRKINLFPAHAGMNRLKLYLVQLSVTVPRTRGDEPGYERDYLLGNDCSPHTRG